MNKKILIARGDSEGARALSFLLAGSGYRISSHSQASTAIEAVRNERFDLAITDQVLPENREQLQLVSELKRTQPTLPVFLLSERRELDDVIDCIRAGVTDIIYQPGDLKSIFETTNRYLRSESENEEVTWEDMVEVERILSSLTTQGDGQKVAKNAQFEAELLNANAELQELQERIETLTSTLDEEENKRQKAEAMIKQLSDSSENGNSAEVVTKIAELEEREKAIDERAARLAKQRAEIEIQLADLEAQQMELEEIQQNQGSGEAAPAGDPHLQEKFEDLQQQLKIALSQSNEEKLDLEAKIQNLQRELSNAQSASSNTEELEQTIIELRRELSDTRETLAARESELENQPQVDAGVEELEQEKRLLEIEKFKLQEKLDAIESEKHAIEEEHGKRQREITVEKRDAEVSLRELQTKIKEEQLKLQVDQANFKEEMRQFNQAKENFQEDISELQRRQKDLQVFEERLQQMKKDVESGKTAALPNSTQSASAEATVEQAHPASSSETNKDDKFDPDTWKKPPFRKKGSRGPLKIDRNSSF